MNKNENNNAAQPRNISPSQTIRDINSEVRLGTDPHTRGVYHKDHPESTTNRQKKEPDNS